MKSHAQKCMELHQGAFDTAREDGTNKLEAMISDLFAAIERDTAENRWKKPDEMPTAGRECVLLLGQKDSPAFQSTMLSGYIFALNKWAVTIPEGYSLLAFYELPEAPKT